MGENSIKMDNIGVKKFPRHEGKVLVDDIYWERVQIYIKGRLEFENISEGLFIFKNKKNNKTFNIKNVKIKENEFVCRFNIATVNESLLIPGKYLLVYETEAHRYIAEISDQFLKNNEEKLNENEKIISSELNAKNDYSFENSSKEFKKNGDSKKNIFVVKTEKENNTNQVIFNVKYLHKKENSSFKINSLFSLKKIRRKCLFKIRDGLFNIIFNFSKSIHFQKGNTILFTSESRKNLSGNFLFIYNEMKKQNLHHKFKIYNIFKPHISNRYDLIDKLKLPYLLGKSDFIFVDDFHPTVNKVKFSKKQEIIQVWHAVGAFKTIGYSRIGKKGGPFFDSKGHRNYTKVYVSSNSIIPMYAEAFGISESKVISTGVPRTDVLFDKLYIERTKNKMEKEFPIINGKKVVLFAPTFRGDGHLSAYYPFENINFKDLIRYCQNHNAVVLFKMHPFIKEKINILKKYEEYFIDISEYREVNDILVIIDILITDYSSLIYEFAIFKKPMLFYAFDLEDYILNRDFYEPYESFVPGNIVKNFDELINALDNENFGLEKVIPFLDKHFQYQDGLASQRLVKDLFKK
jgi:CDP-ribitol ribitolphosphotransferase